MVEPNSFVLELVIILLLIFANAIFVMAELAVVSARKARLQNRAENGDENARAALGLAESPNRFLSTVQVGITLIGTLTGALGGAALADPLAEALVDVPYIGTYANAVAVAVIVVAVSYLTLVLGELVPKRLALSNPEGIASAIARPMIFLSKMARPIVALLSVSTDAVLRIMRTRSSDEPAVTPEEITVMMEQGELSGIFEEAETEIVESVFRLGDLRAGALMTPRPDIDWLDLNDPLEVNLRVILDSPHNHFPAAENSLDEVTGILRAKDLLGQLRQGEAVLTELIQPAQFVPESMPAFEVLEVLKSAAGNLALVIDEYGGVIGLITLFDVMEAMVGDISLQGEQVQPEAVLREDGSWLVEGMMRIDEFKDLIDIDELPGEDRAGFQTVGGFVMAQIGNVPTVGEKFECCGWRFEVMDMDGLRVDKILAEKIS
jgi:putative hemolysin